MRYFKFFVLVTFFVNGLAATAVVRRQVDGIKLERDERGVLIQFFGAKAQSWLKVSPALDASKIEGLRIYLARGHYMRLMFSYDDQFKELYFKDLKPDELSYEDNKVLVHFLKPTGEHIAQSLDSVTLSRRKSLKPVAAGLASAAVIDVSLHLLSVAPVPSVMGIAVGTGGLLLTCAAALSMNPMRVREFRMTPAKTTETFQPF